MAKVIMVQGTMSSAGKSFLVAGLCRVFHQDGYKTAPFKSQNMALNSYITEEGLEMGRAQVMQAEAAGIRPTVQMNPILLKPTTDMGSQVIVSGRVRANMSAVDYFAYKKKLIPEIMAAYETLAAEYDIIVIEGAGSPAEINLKQDDIVNMGMAKLVSAPVILVGDIDRGGVFAQLYGTIMLLEEEERKRVRGIIINKFRGDVKILEPGLKMLEEKCQIPVVGVLPYEWIDLDEEDSLAERLNVATEKRAALIDIAVICLPRISNFTDFGSLECVEQVTVRYVRTTQQLGEPDLILIPGTKSTIADLQWMRQNGMEALIKEKAANGTLIFGICGGYQILGNEIIDEQGIEWSNETKRDTCLRGMELLPIKTKFEEKKVRTRVDGVFSAIEGPWSKLSGVPFEGYEIHMGRTEKSAPGLTTFLDGTVDGCYSGNICGSYVHGIFDREEVCKRVIEILMEHKGIQITPESISQMIGNRAKYKENQYDKLAQIIRENLDMKSIYAMLEM